MAYVVAPPPSFRPRLLHPFTTSFRQRATASSAPEVKKASSTHLMILPEELMIKVLEMSHPKSVLACQLTCRVFRDVIATSASLRYKLSLYKYGMCDTPQNRLSKAEKLELLTAHGAAWENLDLAKAEDVGLLNGWGHPVAVSGNIIVFRTKHVDAVGPRQDLLVLRVPSRLRQIEGAHWVLNVPPEATSFCIDASQDLLIYMLDRAFHVCTLSTGAVHPLAVGPTGSFSPWNGIRAQLDNLCVCGDHVATGARIKYISVWNWKTGQQISDQISDVRFSSFDFLDEYHILYTMSSEDTLHVYDFRDSPPAQLPQGSSRQPRRFELLLPPIQRATTTRYIRVRRNAMPMRGSSTTGPFHADPRERLVTLQVTTSPVERGQEQLEVHVPARVLLDFFAARGGATADVVPWLAWCDAVQMTPPRRLPYKVQSHMVSYGMRTVAPTPHWDEGVLCVDSYLPWRAGVPLPLVFPEELPNMEQVMSVLCEDGIVCYTPNPAFTKIAQAFWYTF